MSMQLHILLALHEQYDSWLTLLDSLTEVQLSKPLTSSYMSPKDVIAHLYAWQQRSIARLLAALDEREPVFPQWLSDVTPDTPGVNDQINAWLYETYQHQPWTDIYAQWRSGFLHILELGQAIRERDLLDSSRYTWLNGYTLAHVLIASYDHHQEHYEKLMEWLEKAEYER